MSASTSTGRRRRPNSTRPIRSKGAHEKLPWIGVDFANFATRPPSRALLPLLVFALIVALAVASLRIDLIRTRYALAAAMEDEQKLIEEQHALIVAKRKGRDPITLAVLAHERGFRPASFQRSMADPMPSANATRSGLDIPTLPSVSSGPPDMGSHDELAVSIR